MKWFKDWEKRYMLWMLSGFLWVFNWIIIIGVIKVCFNLPTNNMNIKIFGVIMLTGFIFFQGYGLCIMIKGMYLDLKSKWNEDIN